MLIGGIQNLHVQNFAQLTETEKKAETTTTSTKTKKEAETTTITNQFIFGFIVMIYKLKQKSGSFF
jgi:hypothetical protein